MEVAVDHADHCLVVLQHANDHGKFSVSELLGGVFPAVAGDDLVPAFRHRADDQGI